MESCAELVDMTNKFNLGNSLHLLSFKISSEKLIDKLLFIIKPIVEYVFGMHIGFAIGWPIGLFVGKSYVEYFEPVYFDDLNQLPHWRLLPYEFAKNAAIVGVVVGVIVIAIINSKLFSKRVMSFYKKGICDPQEISRNLYKSVGQTERKISRLIKKGKIEHKIGANTNSHKTLI